MTTFERGIKGEMHEAMEEWRELREAGADDHPYGAWRGGKASGGGGPASSKGKGTDAQRRREMGDRVGKKNVGRETSLTRKLNGKGGAPKPNGKAAPGKEKDKSNGATGAPKPLTPPDRTPAQQKTVSPEEAIDRIARGERPSVEKKDVGPFLVQAAKRDDHLDLTELGVAGTLKFGGDGLGLTRSQMPQLAGDDLDLFLGEMRAKGVKVTNVNVNPAAMKPIQKEISAKKVAGMTQAMRDGTMSSGRIVITSDDFVLDGHHRWGAATALSFERKGVTQSAIRIDMPAKQLLGKAGEFTRRKGIKNLSLQESLRMLREAAMRAGARLREAAAADDHPYGAWAGGTKSKGGGMVHKGGVADVAKSMRAEAEEAEPRITEALKGIAADTGGSMVGLEFRLKEEKSLRRKIRGDMKAGVASKNGLSAGMAGAGINDHLRYTMLSSDAASYTQQYVSTRKSLAKAGYKPMKTPKDFWTDVPPPPLYQGVNAIFVGPKGQRFELQFHTPASLAAKDKTHPFFKAFGDTSDNAIKAKNWKAMQDIQAPIKAPAGWPPPGQQFRSVAGRDFVG